jgi:hypothetical protein
LFADGDIEVDVCDKKAMLMMPMVSVLHDDANDDSDDDNDDGGDGNGYD